MTALTIMQALDLMGAQAGKSIFISGGTGGVGSMAIPIAKAKVFDSHYQWGWR
ncbi:MAG: hypothetical protein ACLS9T_08990 [Streptococcus salivarius]